MAGSVVLPEAHRLALDGRLSPQSKLAAGSYEVLISARSGAASVTAGPLSFTMGP